MINEHELIKVDYLQLLLQLADRVLDALKNIPAQAGAIWAVHIIPGLHEPGHLTDFGAARCAQLWQHPAA